MAFCKICKAPNAEEINHLLRTRGKTQQEIAQMALDAGVKPPVHQSQVAYHFKHIPSVSEEVGLVANDAGVAGLIHQVRGELEKEMEGQPATIKALYVTAIAKIGDLARDDEPKPELAIRALGEIGKIRGNAGQMATLQAFMAGAQMVAGALQQEIEIVPRRGTASLTRSDDGERDQGVLQGSLRDGSPRRSSGVAPEGPEAGEPPVTGELVGEDGTPDEGRDPEGLVQDPLEEHEVLVGAPS